VRFRVIDALTTQLHGRSGLQGQVERAQTAQLYQPNGNEQMLEVRRGRHHQTKVDHQSRGKEPKMGILRLETETETKGWENWMGRQPEHGANLDSMESVAAGVNQVKWKIPMKRTWSGASSDE